MKETTHTTDDPTLQQLRALRYTEPIDVTDAVMARISTMPLLSPHTLRRQRLQRWTTAVAACAVIAVAINITLLFTRNYNETQISNVIASVYDYNLDYQSSSPINQSVALEYL